jgi:thiamine-monophosphate kinase
MELKASDLGERGIIELIWKTLSERGAANARETPLPHPDDATAIRIGDGRCLLLKSDTFVKRTDAPKGMRHRDMGRKALVMNLSDLAAKGAEPLAFLFSLGVPRGYASKHIEGLVQGLAEASEEYGIPILGGDVCESRELFVAGFATGTAKRVVSRSGASPGDIVAVTGPFGDTAAALRILLGGLEAPPKLRRDLLRSVYRPSARLKLGKRLAEEGVVTSSMDSSDGLAFTLNELAKSSGVGMRIGSLPLSPTALEFSRFNGINPSDLVFFGGEEYEIVYTVARGTWEAALKSSRASGGCLIGIGEVIKGSKVTYAEAGKETLLPSKGWEHLK